MHERGLPRIVQPEMPTEAAILAALTRSLLTNQSLGPAL